MALLLDQDDLADVTFVVGNPEKTTERIPAISGILSVASDVFKAMFRGNFERPKEVDVPDGDPEAFKVILRYIYTDEAFVDIDNALDVLYLAKKYMLTALVAHAVTFLRDNLSPENICLFIPYMDLLEEIKHRCNKILNTRSADVLRSDTFLSISQQELCALLSRQLLCVDEFELFVCALKWARASLDRTETEHSPSS